MGADQPSLLSVEITVVLLWYFGGSLVLTVCILMRQEFYIFSCYDTDVVLINVKEELLSDFVNLHC